MRWANDQENNMTGTAEFLDVDESFLAQSLAWFQNDEFRSQIMAGSISEDAQKKWFKDLPLRYDYRVWGVKTNRTWIGACGLKKINNTKGQAEYWGYIFPKELRGVGFGKGMFDFCLRYAREIGLSKINLTVSATNFSAQNAYLRWGFRPTSCRASDVIKMEIETQ